MLTSKSTYSAVVVQCQASFGTNAVLRFSPPLSMPPVLLAASRSPSGNAVRLFYCSESIILWFHGQTVHKALGWQQWN